MLGVSCGAHVEWNGGQYSEQACAKIQHFADSGCEVRCLRRLRLPR